MLSEKLSHPSRQWLLLALTVGLALAVALSLVFADEADAHKKKKRHFTKVSTVVQSGFIGDATASNPLTATPYTYSGTARIRSINHIRVTLTGSATNPADTGLVLGLDGIDTGIPLNGFSTAPAAPATFTARGTPANARQIKAALKADNQLVGTIIDRTPADANILTIPATSNTTLVIKGIRRS